MVRIGLSGESGRKPYRVLFLRETIVKSDQILFVKIEKYVCFGVYCRSYVRWFPVILTMWTPVSELLATTV